MERAVWGMERDRERERERERERTSVTPTDSESESAAEARAGPPWLHRVRTVTGTPGGNLGPQQDSP